MNDDEAIQLVEKCVWDWKNIHGELNEVLQYLKKRNNAAHSCVLEIAEIEDRLIEEAQDQFQPLLEKLKVALRNK